MQHWYVVRTRSLQEYKTRDQLTDAGVEAYLPCVPSERPRRGHADTPLFPGYVFAQLDPDTDEASVLSRVDSLARIVTFGGVAPVLPDEAMSNLQQRVEELAARGVEWYPFKPGDSASVVIGNTETLGQVLETSLAPRARARVLVEFLGRLIETTVPVSRLRPDRAPRRTRGGGRFIRGFRS